MPRLHVHGNLKAVVYDLTAGLRNEAKYFAYGKMPTI